MNAARPVLQIREWSTTTPDHPTDGALLRGLQLTPADRELLDEIGKVSSLKITELRDGISVAVDQHVGTLTLSGVRIVVLPKIRIDNLMSMVFYAFDLSDLALSSTPSTYEASKHGLVDLLGISLLHSVERIARGGLLAVYQSRSDDLPSPRGRIDIRHAATHPRQATLRCTYDELTADHLLNQVIGAGLRLSANVMQNVDLRLDLARSADRLCGDLERITLDNDVLRRAQEQLDRRSSHYKTALHLIALIYAGSRLGEHASAGSMPLSGFMLNMNTVFERFLERYIKSVAPDDIQVVGQDVRSDVFQYLERPKAWRHPTIRPDLVFKRRGLPIAIGDAKYKSRNDHPPSTAELYQLTTYGLSYPMPEPREVLLLHPLGTGESDKRTVLRFAPGAASQEVLIRLVGVPIDDIVEGKLERWWPLSETTQRAAVVA